MQDGLRDALARLPAGVVLVSTRLGKGFRGLTATSFTSVSGDPPLVLVCLDSLSSTCQGVAESGAFNVSVLGRSQEFFAERFSGRAPAVDAAWAGIPHRLGSNQIPILAGSIAWLECSLEAIHSAGDHEVAVGRVHSCGSVTGDPLVLWERAFWSLA